MKYVTIGAQKVSAIGLGTWQLDEIKSLRTYIQSSGVGARLCPAPHAGRLALGQNLGSLLHCHGAGQQRLVVQVLRPMHQHGDPTPWGRWCPQQLACWSALGHGRELPLARLNPRAQLPRNRYNSFFVSASELEGEKGIRVAPVANPILR